MGCNFLRPGLPGTLSGCQPGASFPSEGYSCSSNQALSCNFDRTSKAVCVISQITNLPSEFRWFGDDTGGTDQLADFCPIPLAASNGACNIGSNDPGILDGFRRGESYGDPMSRCFNSQLNEGEQGVNIPALAAPVCHVSRCPSENDLRVRIGSRFFYRCPAGQSLNAQDFGGSLDCPTDPRSICVGFADTSSEWPVFESVSPRSGREGTPVTITGRNFENGTIAFIGGSECDDVAVQSSTQLTCTLSTSGQLRALFGQSTSVVVENSNGNNDAVINAFTINANLSDLAQDIEEFITGNPGAFVGIILGICCICACCGFCCYKEYKAHKKEKMGPTMRAARSGVIGVKKLTIGRKEGKRFEW